MTKLVDGKSLGGLIEGRCNGQRSPDPAAQASRRAERVPETPYHADPYRELLGRYGLRAVVRAVEDLCRQGVTFSRNEALQRLDQLCARQIARHSEHEGARK